VLRDERLDGRILLVPAADRHEDAAGKASLPAPEARSDRGRNAPDRSASGRTIR
jgi:hypothetical protein